MEITLYYAPMSSSTRVQWALEELGVPYEKVKLNLLEGDQKKPEFLAVNPNGKVPALVDGDAVVFDSNAILLYLADKAGRFVPAIADSAARGSMLSWLMFVASGIGPFSGQAVHFRHAAPQPKEYALNRYDYEAHRHWKLIEDRLAANRFMLGDEYGIVDMAVWGWARLVPYVLGGETPWAQYPGVKRLLDEVSARPAAQRAEKLKTAHTFKTETDDEARRFMFPQNERLKRA